MASIYDIEPGKLIEKASKQLEDQKIVEMPEWAKFVKTSHGKERPPLKNDWWYKRAASILRKIYVLGPIGVAKLSRKYGCKKDRGHKPEKTVRGSTKIIRTILQQLEKSELIISAEKGVHKGKILTPKGKSFLDKLSKDGILKTKEEKPVEVKSINVKEEKLIGLKEQKLLEIKGQDGRNAATS